jgi:hypothetical protein
MAAVVFAGFGAAGCGAAHRPDADVARAVEAADRQRLAAIALASADDELPVALPAAGRVAVDAGTVAPQPLASVPGNGVADRFFADNREASPGAFTFSLEPDQSLVDDGRDDSGGRSGEGSGGKPKLRLQLFRFTVLGRPVGLRCGIKKKHLMFGAKITL